MNKVLVLAAVSEAATGVALLMVPSLVGQWRFGAELTGMAMTVARMAGLGVKHEKRKILALLTQVIDVFCKSLFHDG